MVRAFRQLDHVEARHGIDTLPGAEGVHDLLDFLVLVLRALAGVDAWDVNDRLQ